MPEQSESGLRQGTPERALPVAKESTSGSVVALLYHELRPEPTAYSYVLPCRRFEEHLLLFDELAVQPHLYRPLLTFDDGHLSNYEFALPRLQEHGRNAHFFITAGWTGQRAGYMRPEHLRALQTNGHTIGAHGWSHKLLTQCGAAELQRELKVARIALEDWIAAPVTSVSLPGGRANDRVMAACTEAGYTTVWTSVPGAEALPLSGSLSRFNIHADATDGFLRRLLDPASGVLQAVRRKQRWKQRLQALLGDRLYGRLWAVLNHQEAGESETRAEMTTTP